MATQVTDKMLNQDPMPDDFLKMGFDAELKFM